MNKDSEIAALEAVLDSAITHATAGKNAKTTEDLVLNSKKMMDVINGDVGNGVAAHIKLAKAAVTKAMGTNIQAHTYMTMVLQLVMLLISFKAMLMLRSCLENRLRLSQTLKQVQY